jgi:DNA polymerase elongation subunit (family B)
VGDVINRCRHLVILNYTLGGFRRKRDRSRLEKEFPLNYLTQYLLSKAKAKQYYQELTKVIRSGDFPVEQLQVTQKISLISLINFITHPID